MSKFTTGEIAKLCGVTVRTVQYYDTRGILVPAELSEGGRRLYSENDLKRMKIICFLRDLGLPLDSIYQMLSEEDLRHDLKDVEAVSFESIGDIAYTMMNKKKLWKMRAVMLLTGIPVTLLQWAAIILWITRGWWWLFVLWAVIAIPWGIVVSKYYYDHTAYLCPQCHTVFTPTFKEMFFARHTPSTRKLTCTSCGHHGFCVEVAKEEKA